MGNLQDVQLDEMVLVYFLGQVWDGYDHQIKGIVL